MTPQERLQNNLLELQSRLLTANPELPLYLKAIHEQLINQPELLHILKDEDIAAIVQGTAKYSGVVLASESFKKTKAKIAKKGVTMEDLGL
jgi:hypothetical protein